MDDLDDFEEGLDDGNPGKLIWHVSCDESGTGGARFYGYGSVWMRYQRRGEFSKLMRDLREKHNCYDELKWQKAHSQKNQAFYEDVIDMFFKHPWLAFHCIIVQKSHVDKSYHNGNYNLAMRKHFTKLITSKIIKVIKTHPNRECEFRIDVDPIPSSYKKADEALHKIANNVIFNATGKKEAIKYVKTKDSKHSHQIQIADFLLGAVMSAFQGKASNPLKIEVARKIASYIGWEDFSYDTMNFERKFNIWYFYDPTKGPRELETKPVKLKYPLPRRKKRPPSR
ncbi:DUF3800 domain-containing protein [Pantoea stewartii]|uniref:DUF3800 domain-containing protein n=1 Tax=Pantoea stewartii TaxID=66269 RepID=UPI00138FA1A4|nr:DUF3800 domain-containing protein [Pantoea stewartii]